MDKIPENVINKDLYLKAKKKADQTYNRHSAYKSMFIVKTYKELGGKYKDTKKKDGVSKWNSEKWIQVSEFLLSGKKVPCGEGMNSKGCRPTVRVDKNTPITINELIKLHGKTKLLEFAKKKKKDMDKRARWKDLKFD